MKTARRYDELPDGYIRRYGKMVAAVGFLTLAALAVAQVFEVSLMSFAALATALILAKLFYFHWQRWFMREDAEARITETLDALSNEYTVLTDVALPDSKGNIDRLLVGPNGVFVIETKHYSGSVACDEDRWFLNGHALRSLSKEVKRNSLAVRSAIAMLFTPPGNDIPFVAPILVFVNPQTKLQLFKPTVPVLNIKELSEFIRDYQPKRTLTAYEQRSIFYHLQSHQPGFEDVLEEADAAEEGKKIA